MSTLFGTLGVAKSALTASQLALQTASNNVANAATPGYSRQRADLVESPPEMLPIGQVGTGVSIDGIRRLRDRFADSQFRQANYVLGQREAEHSSLRQIQSILGEPSDVGAQASLAAFFAALQDLANNPADLTARTNLKERAMVLAGDFNRLQSDLTVFKRSLESEIIARVGEANTLLQQIATLNSQIQAVVVGGGSPNQLQDRRDKLVDDLSKLVAITVQDLPDGNVQIGLLGGGGMLVDRTTFAQLTAQLSGISDDYEVLLGGSVVTLAGGTLKGLLNVRNDPTSYVKYAQGQLDTLARGIILEINRIHASGIGLQGLTALTGENPVTNPASPLTAAGLPFTPASGSFKVFVYNAAGAVTASGTVAVTAGVTTLTGLAMAIDGVDGAGGLTATVGADNKLTITAPAGGSFTLTADTSDALAALGLHSFFSGSNAQTMAVSASVQADVRTIAAATPDPTTGAFSPGDNSSALRMAQRRQALTMQSGTATFDDFFGATIGLIGSRTQGAGRLAESQNLVATTLRNRREEVSGVSVDEEMTDLIRFQRAFEAAARVVRMVDELLETVVNRMGV